MTPEPNIVMVVRPAFDDSTKYSEFYLGEIVTYAQSLGYEVIDIGGDNLDPNYVISQIKEKNPLYVFVASHGCTNVVTASLEKDLFFTPPGCEGREHSDENVSILQDRIVFYLACDTDIVTAETARYASRVIGFQNVFGWVSDNQRAPLYDPSSDKYAVAYFASINEMLKSLLDKNPLKTVAKSYTDSINYWLSYWKTSIDAKAEMVTNWLLIDRNSLVIYENGQLTLTTEEKFNPLIIAAAGLGALLLFSETVERTTSLFGEK